MLKYEVYRARYTMAYYRHGEYHRIVGPAYIERDGIFFMGSIWKNT